MPKQGQIIKGSRQKGVLNIRTDPQLHREFAAACALQGVTIQDKIMQLMKSTTEETFATIRKTPKS